MANGQAFDTFRQSFIDRGIGASPFALREMQRFRREDFLTLQRSLTQARAVRQAEQEQRVSAAVSEAILARGQEVERVSDLLHEELLKSQGTAPAVGIDPAETVFVEASEITGLPGHNRVVFNTVGATPFGPLSNFSLDEIVNKVQQMNLNVRVATVGSTPQVQREVQSFLARTTGGGRTIGQLPFGEFTRAVASQRSIRKPAGFSTTQTKISPRGFPGIALSSGSTKKQASDVEGQEPEDPVEEIRDAKGSSKALAALSRSTKARFLSGTLSRAAAIGGPGIRNRTLEDRLRYEALLLAVQGGQGFNEALSQFDFFF